MARLSLNKSSLTRQKRQLDSYEQFLPSLDMKRKQLIAELGKARSELAALRRKLEALDPEIAETLPMLADERIDLTDMVAVKAVELREQNVMGARIPFLSRVDIRVREYAFLGKPHWVDRLVDYLRRALELRIRTQVAQRRLRLLDEALRVITQRVNLFDKVLIPRTKANIKKIEIYLSDADRAGVVRAKIAKQKKEVAV
ncbi:MAG: V-type ATP synthase subunit D [Pseudomonadota bacterium]